VLARTASWSSTTSPPAGAWPAATAWQVPRQGELRYLHSRAEHRQNSFLIDVFLRYPPYKDHLKFLRGCSDPTGRQCAMCYNLPMGQQIIQVDAFADKPFSAIPRRYAILEELRDDPWMQSVARE